MTATNVLVRVRDDAHARIAWAVASIPTLAPVGMLGRKPPPSWKGLVHRARTSSSADIVVDPDPDDDGVVVVAGDSDRPGITHASPEGLARCLAQRLSAFSPEIVWTTSGASRRGGRAFAFPPPVGVVRGGPGAVSTPGPFAAVGAFGTERSIVCVDERPFLEAVCIAAGAAVASGSMAAPTPVWEHADAYIEACETLGLVLAEGVSFGRS